MKSRIDAGINIEADVTREAHSGTLLRRLWIEICTLPVHQRRALALNVPGLDLRTLPQEQIASFSSIAGTLEMTPEALAALWNRLPLDDTEIAGILGTTEAKVRNLRQSAYRTLAWRLRPFGRGALRRLWLAALQLAPLRPAVFWLRACDPRGASLLALFPREDIVGRQEIAEKIGLGSETLHGVWDSLPLSFVQIGTLFQRVPQGMALLYEEARAQLKSHLAEMMPEEA